MKKLFTLLVAASMFSLVACGPSAEELAKIAAAKADSIAKVEKEKATADSLAAIETAKQDSIANAQKIADSIAAAAAAKKGGKKK
jgi:hypothetical protein